MNDIKEQIQEETNRADKATADLHELRKAHEDEIANLKKKVADAEAAQLNVLQTQTITYPYSSYPYSSCIYPYTYTYINSNSYGSINLNSYGSVSY